MIYLDSSALLKLVYEEEESAALARWLADRAGSPMVSSDLATVEVLRAARRIDPTGLPRARALLAGLDLIPLSGDLVADAAEIGGDHLRSLDALHLVSAVALGDGLTTVVVYDHRLAAAASDTGLPVAHPGR